MNPFTILARLSSDGGRKRCIMRWREWGLIPGPRATLMIHIFEPVAA